MHELKKIGDEVFLDRDGKIFETLVNYLRNDRKVFPEFTEKNMENHFYKEYPAMFLITVLVYLSDRRKLF
jgi:asparagine synthetase A